ncbi:PRC-barrel domain-containing protein [Actinokineospora spheciospongiae]|uniref:PRC-barrel domain-containing protein n=1 Tax=Actinokineospora spheciospongiae TaxID=909613 RepID=UPI000D71775F|nr:hypothetical protein [Actinokineospora spheciospongiae]PWW53166.1 sporulation protein YlmC with PRC-barrel domain [Actinokineospora spheciospongiae]
MTPDPLRLDFHLLDRQILDRRGHPVGKVDDVELDTTAGAPTVVALLVGQVALGRRFGGALGRWLTAVGRRLHTERDPRPMRIPIEHVREVGSAITLGIDLAVLDEPPLERWLRDHLIARIPGARDARQ